MRPIPLLSLGLFLGGVLLLAAPLGLGAAAQTQAATPQIPAADLPPTTDDAPPTTDAPAPVQARVPAAPQAPTATAALAPPPPTGPAPSAAADINDSLYRNGIVATVNDTPISEYDVRQRVQLRIALAPPNFKPSEEDIKRLRIETLQSLEDEAVERAEAVKRHLTVSPVDINKQIDDLLTRYNFTREQLRKTLADAGTSEAALRDQYVAAEVWRKVVNDEFEADVRSSITVTQIEDQMRRDAEGAHKTHYQVVEIFLPSNGPDQDAKVLETAQNIVERLHKDLTFPEAAREYSRNPSAAAGGDIGWVYDGQLEPALNDALSKMSKNDLSAPIKGTGGYYLLGMRDRQEPLGTDVNVPPPAPAGPPGTLPLARLLLPTGGASKDQVAMVMKTALQIQGNILSCPDLQKVHEQIPGSVYMDQPQFAKLINPGTNLDVVKLSDISEQMQKALANTKPGDIAPPFQDEAGIEVIARCDPHPAAPRTAFVLRTREEVEVSMFQDRAAVLARRYLRELRRQANIQERGPNGQIVDAALATVH